MLAKTEVMREIVSSACTANTPSSAFGTFSPAKGAGEKGDRNYQFATE